MYAPEPHPVLDPLLRHLMRDQAQHARFYRKVASLPGLDGVHPMRRRLEEALARNPEP